MTRPCFGSIDSFARAWIQGGACATAPADPGHSAPRHQERTLPQAVPTAARLQASTTYSLAPQARPWWQRPYVLPHSVPDGLLPAGDCPSPSWRSTCWRLGTPTSNAPLGWTMHRPGARSSAATGCCHAPPHAHSARRPLSVPAEPTAGPWAPTPARGFHKNWEAPVRRRRAALLSLAERERVHGRAHQRGAAGLAALGSRPQP